jgi:hypothetical protein
VESPVGLLELEYGIILGPFLDELLRLYFQNIHPYYPVVDEFDFDASFSFSLENEVLRRSRATVLGAILLCASMVFTGTAEGMNLADPAVVPEFSPTIRLREMDSIEFAADTIWGSQG